MKKLFLIFSVSLMSFSNAQIVSLIDSNSKESVNYEYVGTLPTGAISDGVLFARKDGKFYKRVTNGIVKASWFGVKGDGITDDTQNLQKFFNSIQYSKGQRFVVDGENVLISSAIAIDPLSNIEIDFLANIKSKDEGSLAVVPSVNPFNVRIKNINNSYVGSAVFENKNTGIVLSDLVKSYISFGNVLGFAKGVLISSKLANGGFSYNVLDMGFHHDSEINLALQLFNSVGYINENVFNGGSFNHSTNYPDFETFNLFVVPEHNNINNINNNRFNYMSFEDHNFNASGVWLGGVFNTLNQPRFENPNHETTYGVVMPIQSQYNKIIGGRGLYRSNVVNSGIGNSFTALDGDQISINGTGGNVYVNQYSDNSPVLAFQSNDGSKTITGNITGSGVFTGTRGYFQNGIGFGSIDGLNQDRGLFHGVGAPTYVKANGSIYIDTSGGTGSTLYIRESGVWVAK